VQAPKPTAVGFGIRPKPLLERVATLGRSRLGATLLWLAALLSWAFEILKAARSGGGDIYQIWKGTEAFAAGHPIYFQDGADMSFLYPPSAVLLLLPLAILSFPAAAAVIAVLQAVCISLAGALSLRLAGRFEWWLLPIVVAAASLLLPARNSLWLGNVDGLIAALEVLMLLLASRRRWILAALALGLSLALKPVLLPLLLIFALRRKWLALVSGLALPLAASLIGLLLGRDGLAFATKVVPFLLQGQSGQLQDVNISLAGAALMLHAPAGLGLAARALIALVLAAVLAVRWQTARPPLAEGIRLAELAGLIMLGVLLTFSYAWAHYILFLLPLLALLGDRSSIARGWPAFAAAYLLLFPDEALWSHASWVLSQLRLTAGLLLLLAAVTWSVWPSLAVRAAGFGAKRRPVQQAAD